MSTEPVYYTDPYLVTLDAQVVRVLDCGLVLDRTIFYPEGGGQPGDRGWIDGVLVTGTVHRDGAIVHLMDSPSGFSVGQRVSLRLDWDHRFRFMRAHTAEHMIAGTFHSALGIPTVAIHLADDYLTVELDTHELDDESAWKVESLVNRAILEDHRVSAGVFSHDQAEALGLRRSIKVDGDCVRVVEIEGVDRIGCGGVHVSHTSQAGLVSYAGCEPIRSHVRTIWYYGDGAFSAARRERAAVKEASRLLSAQTGEIADAIRRLIDTKNALSARLREAEARLARCQLESQGPVFTTDIPLEAFQKLASGARFFVTGTDAEGRVRWLLGGDAALFAAFKARFAEFGMRGGGKAPLWQGSAGCGCTELEALARSLILEDDNG